MLKTVPKKDPYITMCDSEYNALYMEFTYYKKSEIKRLLKKFDICMSKKCQKQDYILELIYCLDSLSCE